MKTVRDIFKTTDTTVLLVLLLLVVVLRIPNFFEPYWYGDEGIYLTIGNALNHNSTLYVDIVDHKTPGIYWLAQVGTQLNFRILLLFWMVLSTVFFFLIARRIFSSTLAIIVASTLFVLSTTLPTFEGNIPNGELFVIGPVLLGMWLLLQGSFGKVSEDAKPLVLKKKDWLLLMASGVAFGSAILIKVPALFDWLAAIAFIYFLIAREVTTGAWKNSSMLWQKASSSLSASLWLTLGVTLTIIASVIYFISIGAGDAYLEFGLLYNFHYAGNWGIEHIPEWLRWWFSIPGKATVLVITALIFTFLPKSISSIFRWLALWCVLALVASLLSNRPYPHYFLQVFPPLALLIGYCVDFLLQKSRKSSKILVLSITSLVTALAIVSALLINIYLYPTLSYYQSWIELVSGKQTSQQYLFSFNHLMEDNYRFTASGLTKPGDSIFVWGTNPMLYAQTQTIPAGRFTVSFHIHDLEVYEETMSAVKAAQPNIIISMHNEHQDLPGLAELLEDQYAADESYQHYTVWQRTSSL